MPPKGEFSGKTIEDAIAVGLKELGLPRHEVSITVLDPGVRGAREARVLLSSGSAPTPRSPAPEQSFRPPRDSKPADLSRAEKDVAEIIPELLKHMGFTLLSLKALSDHGHVEVVFETEEKDLFLADGGTLLDAFQSLVSAMTSHRQDARVKLLLDTGGFRAQEQEKVLIQVRETARRVKETGEPFALEPMDSVTRRIVHMDLAEDSGVATESQGLGSRRHIVIKPKK